MNLDSATSGTAGIAGTRPTPDDRYQLTTPLGQGGQATVWRAIDARGGATVAIKQFLRSEALDGRGRVEADILGRLRAAGMPGVVTVLGTDLIDGCRRLVLELIEGRSLAALIPAGGMPLPTALLRLWAAAAVIAPLHDPSIGVIHGDVRADHLIVGADDRLTLLDFGAAALSGTANGGWGTPGLAAPEALTGGVLTAATDVFGLAGIAVHLLTGATHDQPEAFAELTRRIGPRALAAVRRGLALDPCRRPASVAEFITALAAALHADGRADQSLAATSDDGPAGRASRPGLCRSARPAGRVGDPSDGRVGERAAGRSGVRPGRRAA